MEQPNYNVARSTTKGLTRCNSYTKDAILLARWVQTKEDDVRDRFSLADSLDRHKHKEEEYM